MTTMLNEVLYDNDRLFSLLKFSKKEYLEDLRKGKLYLNNFQYFRDVEKKEKRKGQGDAYDLTLKMDNIKWTLSDPESKTILVNGKGNASMEYKEDYQTHVFCTTGITSDYLEIIEEDEKTIRAKLVFPEGFKQQILDGFGDHVLIINPGAFLSAIESAGHSMASNRVKYRNLDLLYSDRVDNFVQGKKERFFEKDNFFKYQNEYRFVFPSLISDSPIVLDIDNIEKESTLMSVEDFFNLEMSILLLKDIEANSELDSDLD
ncbi:hypothetical protein [Bacillus safensis]